LIFQIAISGLEHLTKLKKAFMHGILALLGISQIGGVISPMTPIIMKIAYIFIGEIGV
jgi:hypothetical protein